jgi:hypothetical protein
LSHNVSPPDFLSLQCKVLATTHEVRKASCWACIRPESLLNCSRL